MMKGYDPHSENCWIFVSILARMEETDDQFIDLAEPRPRGKWRRREPDDKFLSHGLIRALMIRPQQKRESA
jgi:hypothetical protein